MWLKNKIYRKGKYKEERQLIKWKTKMKRNREMGKRKVNRKRKRNSVKDKRVSEEKNSI